MLIKEIFLSTIKFPEHMLRSKEMMGDVTSLAESIGQYGLLQPIVVAPSGNKYMYVAGYRRIQAVKKLGWDKITAHIVDTDKESWGYMTLAENQQRFDIHPYDEAIYFKYLQDEKGLNQTEIAKLINKTQAYVSYRLSLLKLDELTQSALINNAINDTQALELGRCKDVPQRQYLLNIVAKDGASGEVIRRWVDKYQGLDLPAPIPLPAPPPGYVPEPTEIKSEGCDFCGDTVPGGGLTAMFACPACWKRLKAATQPET